MLCCLPIALDFHFLLEDFVVCQNILYSHNGSFMLLHVDMSVFFRTSVKSLQNEVTEQALDETEHANGLCVVNLMGSFQTSHF